MAATLPYVCPTSFVNPYNFISLPENSEPIRKTLEKGKLTGVLECSLKVVTPLSIPGQKLNPADEVNPGEYDFLTVGGKPMIPGSEIRGCIRSTYETLTNSCLPIVNDDSITLRALFPKGGKPGILVHGEDGWWISPAEKVKNGKDTRLEKRAGKIVTRKWHNLQHKATFSSYCEDDDAPIRCSESEIKRLRQALDELDPQNDPGISEFGTLLKEKKNCVVFYEDSGEKDKDGYPILSYFSPAQISRNVMHRKVTDLLGAFKPCNDVEHNGCPACRLFGSLNGGAVATRVRFSDAFPVREDSVLLSDNRILLPELGSPKQSSVEFYTYGPQDTDNWNNWTYDTPGVRLRGRKIYLHGGPMISKTEGTKRNQRVQVAKEGGEFSFRVWFDAITQEELDALIGALTLGVNDKNLNKGMHKLGHGRPVGYGSVKITVDQCLLRIFGDDRYSVIKADLRSDFGQYVRCGTLSGLKSDQEDILCKELEVASSFGTWKDKISYPVPTSGRDTNTYAWFAKNRKSGQFIVRLPSLTELSDRPVKGNNRFVERTPRHPINGESQPNSPGRKMICSVCGEPFNLPPTYNGTPTRPLCKRCRNRNRF